MPARKETAITAAVKAATIARDGAIVETDGALKEPRRIEALAI